MKKKNSSLKISVISLFVGITSTLVAYKKIEPFHKMLIYIVKLFLELYENFSWAILLLIFILVFRKSIESLILKIAEKIPDIETLDIGGVKIKIKELYEETSKEVVEINVKDQNKEGENERPADRERMQNDRAISKRLTGSEESDLVFSNPKLAITESYDKLWDYVVSLLEQKNIAYYFNYIKKSPSKVFPALQSEYELNDTYVAKLYELHAISQNSKSDHARISAEDAMRYINTVDAVYSLISNQVEIYQNENN